MSSNLIKICCAGFYDSKKYFKEAKTTPERRVKYYEIEMFCRDGGSSFINGQRNIIEKGNILVAKPGDMRCSKLHFTAKYIHFEADDSLIAELLDSLSAFYRFDFTEEFEDLFDEVYRCILSENKYAMILASAKLLELIYKLKSETLMIESGKRNFNQSPILKAVNYITFHYTENISTHDIAKHCGMSVSYFHKKFVEANGITPNEYINKFRISEAKKMLLSGNEPVSIIAEKCGFNSQAYFTYCFKKSVNISPLKYRNSGKYII